MRRISTAIGLALLNVLASVVYLVLESQHAWTPRTIGLLALTGVADAFLWLLLLSLLPRSRAGSWLMASMLAAALVAVHLLCFGYCRDFRSLPPPSALVFFHRYPSYARALVLERIQPLLAVVAGALCSLFAWVIARAGPRFTGPRRLTLVAPLAALGLLASFFARAPELPLDGYAAATIAESYSRTLPINGGWTPARIPLPAVATANPPNLIVFRLEEVNRDAVGLYHPELQTTPFANQLAEENPEEFFIAKSHLASATATDVAVPLLYTGARPDDPVSVHQRLPMLWDYFAAAGYDTALDIPYALQWGNFDTRFCDRPGDLKLKHLFHAGQPGRTLVYDASVNDADVVNDVLAYQTSRRWAGPFFQIVSLKMPHANGDGARVNQLHLVNARDPSQQHYYDAIAYDDSLMQQVIEAMPPAVRANTVIAVISDHGADTHGRRARLENYYQEATAVPFWLYVPKELQSRLPPTALATLREQLQTQVTTHADFLPTLLDLAGLYREPAFHKAIEELPGRSLLMPGTTADPLVVLSTGALRSWDREGFAVLLDSGHTRYVFDMGREHLFDELKDPADDHDVLSQPAYACELERARLAAATDPALARIVAAYWTRDESVTSLGRAALATRIDGEAQ